MAQIPVTSIRLPLDLKSQIKEVPGGNLSAFRVEAARKEIALIQKSKNSRSLNHGSF